MGLSLYQQLSLAVSAAGFLAVIISVLILARQTSAVARTTRMQAFVSVRDQMLAIDELFLRYPDLRPYFYGGRYPSKDDPQLINRAETVAETILDLFEVVILQRERFAIAWSKETWDAYMSHMFASSRFLCDYLDRSAGWFPEELVTLKRRAQREHR